MALEFERPDKALLRELEGVAEQARGLSDFLDQLNSLPGSFPKELLKDICRALAGLPGGTAEGCRIPLEHARSRLPGVRRENIQYEDMAQPQAEDADPVPVRGMELDRRLTDLIGAVVTALEEYRTQASQDRDEAIATEPGVSAAGAAGVAEAVSDAAEIGERLHRDREAFHEIAKPGSENADRLERRLHDAETVMLAASAELRMPQMVLRWYRALVAGLAKMPDLIRWAAEKVKVGVDIAEIFETRWFDMHKELGHAVLDQIRKWADAAIKIAILLESKRLPPASVHVEEPTEPPEKVYVEPITGMRFLYVPAGEFIMGSDDGPLNERPAHKVRVEAFMLAETPVTNLQFEQLPKISAWASTLGSGFITRLQASDHYPVVEMAWSVAQEFCLALSAVSHRHFRLPSEAEWEYAARGPEGRKYPWGSEEPTRQHALFGLTAHMNPPRPVGRFPANRGPFGHLDLVGGVREWCADRWHESFEGAPQDGSSWQTGFSEYYVIRGGIWLGRDLPPLRATGRGRFLGRDRPANISFRVAMSLPSDQET